MANPAEDLETRLRAAVQHFWEVRSRQADKQKGTAAEEQDKGERGAVTGGKQLDGFVRLVYGLLVESGLSGATIFCRARPDEELPRRKKRKPGDPPVSTRTELPGWFRPEKDWDLLVVVQNSLVAAVEFKSQVGPVLRQQLQQPDRRGPGQRHRPLGGVPGGCFQPLGPPLARIPHAPGRGPGLDERGKRRRTALPGLSRVHRSFLREALRNPAHEAVARAALRRGLFPHVNERGRPRRTVTGNRARS